MAPGQSKSMRELNGRGTPRRDAGGRKLQVPGPQIENCHESQEMAK